MTQRLDTLQAALEAALGGKIKAFKRDRGEITLTVAAADYLAAATTLRDHPTLKFEQLIDLCALDYSSWKDQAWDGPRYCVVSHLLSVSLNWRVRLKVFAADDDVPVVATLSDLWAAANWFEREAFDMVGIVFDGHVEMRYDAEKKRVIYQPVTIEPREITPRVIREDNYGGLH